ncbi:MAG TPA: metal-sulfur cluster assembly factor [Chloroflexota bacterium]|jgi:metal-sulfur cluster biosynthetic enzyme
MSEPSLATVTEEQVYAALYEVYDPELGVNVVDLGLVYGVAVKDSVVEVTMTMTTPGCPMHEAITDGARTAVGLLPGVREAHINVVWFPRWDPSLMSDAARSELWG